MTLQEFDDRDRMISRAEPEGRSSTYAWDGADRQTEESHSSGMRRLTTYNALGQAVQVTGGEGRFTSRTHDRKGNVLTQTDRRGALIHQARNGGAIARFQYQYDANGNRVAQIEENGGPAQTSTYAYE